MRVIHLQVTFGPEATAEEIRTIKNKMHEHAQKLTEGLKNRSVMSVIRIEEQAAAARKGGK